MIAWITNTSDGSTWNREADGIFHVRATRSTEVEHHVMTEGRMDIMLDYAASPKEAISSMLRIEGRFGSDR